MPPRASWTGYLKVSLVTIPIRLYNAISSTSKISLNQLHKNCNQRLKQQMVCPIHGKVEREDIAKGYEFEKDKYVVIDEADLEGLALETTKSIEITQFIERDQLNPIYLNTPYYVGPDGPIAEEAFRVIREAMRQSGKLGIGRVVMSGKEHVVVLDVEDKGFKLSTLYYASEVRSGAAYFEDIRNADVDRGHLELAKQLIEQYTVDFNPEQYKDRYQDALLEIIKQKIEGTTPIVVQRTEVGKVVNIMDALRQSVAQASSKAKLQKKPPAESIKTTERAQKKAKRA